MAGEKILIIDPNTRLLNSIAEQVLLPQGFKPLLATGQDQGVRIAVTEEPQLLLLHLPLDSSVRLLHRLRQGGLVIPSILMVEHESASIDLELLRMGVRDYVSRPFTAQAVLQAVNRVLTLGNHERDYEPVAEDMGVFNRDLDQRLREFNLLLGIGRSVSSSLDLDSVLNRATEAAVFITGAEEGYLLLLDEATGELQLRAAQNLGEKQAQGFSLQVDDSLAGSVVRSGKPMLLSGDGKQNLKVKTGYLVKSLLNVPLKADGQVIGVLGVDNRMSNARFTLAHLRQLSALGEMVATAVENARRYTELHNDFTKRATEIATLQAVAEQLGASADFDLGVRLALSLVLKVTNAEAGVLAWAPTHTSSLGKDTESPIAYISQGRLGEATPDLQGVPRDPQDAARPGSAVRAGEPYPQGAEPYPQGAEPILPSVAEPGAGLPERWWNEHTLQMVMDTGEPLLRGNLDPSENGRKSKARSRLAVPVRRGSRVVGAIDLESTSPSAFTQDDLQFVLRIADQVALAMEGTLLQERVEAERERQSLLMDAVDNAVWVVDADLRLLAQNEAASHMLGWPSEEAIGRSLYEFTPSHNPSAALRTSPSAGLRAGPEPDGVCHMLGQVMEKRQRLVFPQRGERGKSLLLETKEGRPVLIQGRAIPMLQDGRVIGAICAFREVPTENSDEHVRFEFTNMASHLLRSPLSFIQASVDLMLNSELPFDEQQVILHKMREQSQRMRDFIRDLLEISHLETGSVSIYPEPVALPPLVRRVLALVRPEEPHYVVNFNSPHPFPVVAADPAKMELVLLSLLRSAMNRCPLGGCIGVELEASASEVIVSITDDGEPIPPKQLDRMFSQFYPVDDDGDKMPSTYILGLFTTRRLVELQNGRVWAESTPDTGTRFGFSLPIWGCADDS